MWKETCRTAAPRVQCQASGRDSHGAVDRQGSAGTGASLRQIDRCETYFVAVFIIFARVMNLICLVSAVFRFHLNFNHSFSRRCPMVSCRGGCFCCCCFVDDLLTSTQVRWQTMRNVRKYRYACVKIVQMPFMLIIFSLISSTFRVDVFQVVRIVHFTSLPEKASFFPMSQIWMSMLRLQPSRPLTSLRISLLPNTTSLIPEAHHHIIFGDLS